MKVSKYLIVRTFDLEVPIVFSPLLSHSDFHGGHKIVAAGFCHRNSNGTVVTNGKSVTLGISSRDHDSKIIETMLESDV